MSTSTREILTRMAQTGHRGGAFSSEVLIAISAVLPEGPIVTLETGCGKSTVLFSNIAAKHYVFAFDDREMPDSSVSMVLSNPDFKSGNVVWVYGPTQKTVPYYQFPDDLRFDVIMLDGPHGYPFPDLEYAFLYDKLKTGGLLILDDVHIASIGNMYDTLREDRMYLDVGVFATTGILRRSSVDGVPRTGDHWYEQNYNVSRFPVDMGKYRPDRSARFGETLKFSDRPTLAKYAVKAVEHYGKPGGAKTTDILAVLAFDLPASNSSTLKLELEHTPVYGDSGRGAQLIIGGKSFALQNASHPNTETFEFKRPDNGRLQVLIVHPEAVAEHDRRTRRYDFRRLGSEIHWVRITEASTQTDRQERAGGRVTSPRWFRRRAGAE